MNKKISKKWMALVVVGACAGCSTGSGAKSGWFASWTSPISSMMASKPAVRSDEQDDAIRLDKKPKATADFFIAGGNLAKSRGDMQNAVAQYAHAVKLEPKNVNAHRHLAKTHVEMRNYPEAEQVYASAIALSPTDPTPLNDLALCLVQQQRYDEAIGALNKAIALRPHEPTYRTNMAGVLVRAGRPREAYEHLVVVHSKAEAHYNLGFLLREDGQFEAARQQMIAAVQVDPGMDAAHQVLAELGNQTPRTAHAPQQGPAAKEVSAPRYLRAQSAPKNVIEQEDLRDDSEAEAAPVAPKGYYDGVEEGEKKTAAPEVLAKLPKSKPAVKSGKKSAAALKAKIEDSEPVLR